MSIFEASDNLLFFVVYGILRCDYGDERWSFMKKILLLFLIFTAVVQLAACGCSDSADRSAENTPTATSVPMGAIISSFKAPGLVVEVDLTKEDPSNDKIKFDYDKQGRVSGCTYKIDGRDTYVGYTYKKDEVDVYAFIGDVSVFHKTYKIVKSDSSLGFTDCEGFYFKNLTVKSLRQ